MKKACSRSGRSIQRARICRSGPVLLACLLLNLLSLNAKAAYRIDIDAPVTVKTILEEHLDLARYKDRKDLNQDQIEFMISTTPQRVAALVATEGFFSPRTTVKVGQVAGGTLIKINVDVGERTKVNAVTLDVDGPALMEAPEQVARLRKSWLLPPGQPFRQENWDEAKHNGLQILQRQRFAAARIADSSASVDADALTADLTVRYDSGPLFTLGEIVIKGPHRYPERIIRNLNPLSIGEVYKVDRLLEFQRQIQRTPYFSNVVIDIDKDPDKATLTPVTVTVSEFPKQRVRAGAGYATDTGTRLEGRYSHHNVFSRAWVADVHTRLEEERQLGVLDLAMPPDSKAFVNSGHVLAERTTLEGIELSSRRLGLRRTRATDAKDIRYSLEHYRDQLQPMDGSAPPENTVVELGSHQALVTSIGMTRRSVDNPAFPRRGRVFSVELGGAVKGLATDQTFFRAYGQAREYLPVGRRDLIILHAELGSIISKGGNASIPASLMFRTGGTDSVRGYAFQSIGNERDGKVYPTRFIVTGGVEYQHWFSRQIYKQRVGAAIFYDVGSATDRWTERPLFHGIGIGARWRSPVGPINADLAYGLQGKTIRPHISLGVAF